MDREHAPVADSGAPSARSDMGLLSVSLLSTAPATQVGSMGIYGGLVQSALAAYAPQLEVLQVPLRDGTARLWGGLGARVSGLAEIARARRRARAVNSRVCHLLDGSFGFMTPRSLLPRTLVTVHDLIPALQGAGVFAVQRPGWAARQLIAASLGVVREAGAVVAVSEATAADVLRLTGRVVDAVIHHPLRSLPAKDQGRSVTKASPVLVLHVGNNGFYKNRLGVVRIFSRILRWRPEVRLVLAGAPPDAPLCAEIAALGLGERVSFEVHPDDLRLMELYRRAALLLFPSLYEGFGWPPLEAMHFECPVVCSDAGSLPEVTGCAALRCPPDDLDGLAAAAVRVLEAPALAAELVAKGKRNLERFEARRMASQLVALYEGLAQASA